jgi:hypothetical protein
LSHAVIAAILVGHGAITSMIGFGAVTNPNAPATTLPSWFAWWPGPFGRSWLFEALSLGSGASVMGGLIWLAGGLLIIGGGLGWFGVGAFEGSRTTLLVAGAVLSLLALAVYFHPIYLAAVAINLVIVVALWSDVFAARSAA